MDDTQLIDGIILSGYRSFGPEPQKIGPFRKINLFVGKNNSGKSNIIRYIRKCYGGMLKASDSFLVVVRDEPISASLRNANSIYPTLSRLLKHSAVILAIRIQDKGIRCK